MKELTFTKEERNAIYIKALELYLNRSTTQLGLCFAVSKAAVIITSCNNTISYDHSYDSSYILGPINGMKIHFPEVYKHRPKGAQADWFSHSTRGINKRIAILNQTIKETSI